MLQAFVPTEQASTGIPTNNLKTDALGMSDSTSAGDEKHSSTLSGTLNYGQMLRQATRGSPGVKNGAVAFTRAAYQNSGIGLGIAFLAAVYL